jgi:hypothetical protein
VPPIDSINDLENVNPIPIPLLPIYSLNWNKIEVSNIPTP